MKADQIQPFYFPLPLKPFKNWYKKLDFLIFKHMGILKKKRLRKRHPPLSLSDKKYNRHPSKATAHTLLAFHSYKQLFCDQTYECSFAAGTKKASDSTFPLLFQAWKPYHFY